MKDDENWFSTSSIKDLKRLAESNDEHKDRVRPVEEEEEHQDSQSFMSFANDRMKQIINDDSFCGLFTDQTPDQVNAVQGN